MTMTMIPRTRTKIIPLVVALALLPLLLYLNGWEFDQGQFDDDDDQRILEPWVPSQAQGRQLQSTTPMAPRGKVAALASWYTYSRDPQRGSQVSSESIEYIYNLYTTATHFGVPLVVFHDALTEEFVAKYTNEYVSFQHAIPDPSMSTNDFRFFPYLEYVKEHKLDSILMVDASDVFFNSDPFSYIQEHEGPKDQLFMSHDNGSFTSRSWKVPQCYGKESLSWPRNPKKKMYNAGVWGGKGPAVQCILECVTQQIDGPLRGKGNCNMATVNYCVNHGPCQKDGPIVHENPKFVNPMGQQCRENYAVVHNKCSDTQYGTLIKIVEGEVVLTELNTPLSKITKRKEKRMIERRKARVDEERSTHELIPA